MCAVVKQARLRRYTESTVEKMGQKLSKWESKPSKKVDKEDIYSQDKEVYKEAGKANRTRPNVYFIYSYFLFAYF